jgi:RNA polymerase sigma factor (sigma-70 family)
MQGFRYFGESLNSNNKKVKQMEQNQDWNQINDAAKNLQGEIARTYAKSNMAYTQDLSGLPNDQARELYDLIEAVEPVLKGRASKILRNGWLTPKGMIQFGQSVRSEDLIEATKGGIIKNFMNYDPEFSFMTFVKMCAATAMEREGLRNEFFGRRKLHTAEAQKRFEFNGGCDLEDLALLMGERSSGKCLESARLYSIMQNGYEPLEGQVEQGMYNPLDGQEDALPVEDRSDQEVYQELDLDARMDLENALSGLDERSRDVFLRRNLFGEKLQEIGDDYGLSSERIRQIEVKAIDVLKKSPALSSGAYREIPIGGFVNYERKVA